MKNKDKSARPLLEMRWKIRVAQGFQTKSAILVDMAAIINYSQWSLIILKNLSNMFPQLSRFQVG